MPREQNHFLWIYRYKVILKYPVTRLTIKLWHSTHPWNETYIFRAALFTAALRYRNRSHAITYAIHIRCQKKLIWNEIKWFHPYPSIFTLELMAPSKGNALIFKLPFVLRHPPTTWYPGAPRKSAHQLIYSLKYVPCPLHIDRKIFSANKFWPAAEAASPLRNVCGGMAL